MPSFTLPEPLAAGANLARALLRQTKRRQHSSSHMPTRSATATQTLEPAAVAAFHRVIGAPVTDAVHPGYLHTLGFPLSMRLMTDRAFPLPLLGLVHIGNSFTLHRTVRVGEAVTTTVHLGQPRQHRKGTAFDVVACGTIDGETVFEETSTYLAVGRTLSTAHPAPEEGHSTFTAPGVPAAIWKLKPAIGRAYARVSGDWNPIHINPLAAKAFGFPASIAHGMYTASRGLAEAQADASAGYVWDVTFAKPVVLPARVGYGVFDDAAAGQRSYAVWNLKKGSPHVRAQIRPLT